MAKKPTKKAASKSPKKPAAAKAAPKTKTAKKTTKPAATKSSTRPLGAREQKLANSALKLVDEAAALLRKGINTTADVSEKNRLAAKKRAHGLLNKATSSLSSILGSSSDALHKVIGKI
ncbi:hypothetical protein TSACC_22591 [Terrimicrobium sacchariphilum]|uniref:Uncharacterized protein n=1 Tax=Terrimicrobium sacchariphilum TaxID=690879 RepID=A0A146GBL6_TERSA|nr:hypothetical protein [Terrimicrobium sacchariphilum]GAT34167.1 hypothetical protein TSACC_22591 [Terrimicrobium sacchariphilum]